MNTQKIVQFSNHEPKCSESYPETESRIRGTPKRITCEYFSSPSHGVRTGTWEAEPGAYSLAFPATKHEVFHVLSGVIDVIARGEAARRFEAGDTCVLPAGFNGVFDIKEHAKKVYIVCDR